jgi:hypothetical protein
VRLGWLINCRLAKREHRQSLERPPLRSASRTTSPPNEGGEEGCEAADLGALPLPPEGGEVAPRSGDGVGEGREATHSRRKNGTTARALAP